MPILNAVKFFISGTTNHKNSPHSKRQKVHHQHLHFSPTVTLRARKLVPLVSRPHSPCKAHANFPISVENCNFTNYEFSSLGFSIFHRLLIWIYTVRICVQQRQQNFCPNRPKFSTAGVLLSLERKFSRSISARDDEQQPLFSVS